MAWTAPRSWSVGEIPTAAEFNTHLRDNLLAAFPAGVTFTSYTPALTTFDLGSGTVTPNLGSTGVASGRYLQIGKLVFSWATLVWSGAGCTAGTGGYLLSLPVNASTVTISAGQMLGSAFLSDASTNARNGMCRLYDATHLDMYVEGANQIVNQSTPTGWGVAAARIDFNIVYEAA